MPTVSVTEAKARLSVLIGRALAGEEIVISKRGKPVFRLVSFKRDTSPRDMNVRVREGEVRIAEDFDTLPEDFHEVLYSRAAALTL